MSRIGQIASNGHIAVVIPCFRVTGQVCDVIARIGPEVRSIFAVDDACPEGSGDYIEAHCLDPRVTVIRHAVNKGVGGAVVTGYRAALAAGADVVVKMDGDGQMDPALLPLIAAPVVEGLADYAKGNRFQSIWSVRQMPAARLLGNSALSFLTKMSSGYWSVFDPTNGYTAIHSVALRRIDFAHVNERYFFESDMLIHLGDIRAVVADVPMEAHYGEETSSLRIGKVLGPFLSKNFVALARRVLYTHFMRDFSLASAQLVLGLAMLVFGVVFGALAWRHSVLTHVTASTGTVMIAVLPIVLGFQLVLSFLGFDMANEPKRPLQPQLTPREFARLSALLAPEETRR